MCTQAARHHLPLPAARTTLGLVGNIVGLGSGGVVAGRRLSAAAPPTFDRAVRDAYLASLNKALPAGTTSTVTSVVPAGTGFAVATSSLLGGSGTHEERLASVRRLVESDAPLGPTPLGPSSPGRVFFSALDALTGARRDVVHGTHLLLTDATALSATTARTTAQAIPSDAFIKVCARESVEGRA